MSDIYSSLRVHAGNILMMVRSLQQNQHQINSSIQSFNIIVSGLQSSLESENERRQNLLQKGYNVVTPSCYKPTYTTMQDTAPSQNIKIKHDEEIEPVVKQSFHVQNMNIDTTHLQHENFNNIIQIPITKDNETTNDVEGLKKAYNSNIGLNSSEKMYDTGVNINPYENLTLKEKFYQLKEKSNKRYFQVVYIFKKKIKRMYRIDCMTRKINVNFYHYIKENCQNLDINDELLDFFKNNIRYTSRTKFQEFEKKYPNFKKIYDNYLKSDKFKKLILMIKNKYDEEYLKLFFRHSKNFLNFYLKDSSHSKLGRKFGSKNLKTRISEYNLQNNESN